MDNPFARLPAISSLLADPRLADLPHALAVEAARATVDAARRSIRQGESVADDLAAVAVGRAQEIGRPRLRRVINATGIVLHTNLGRAPLAPAAVAAVTDAARGYSNLEMLLDTGARGGRLEGVRDHLRALTGAEDALVVNNCAAAVLLALTALARDHEVVVSRGELVEIGGSFRVPDVVSAGGAQLVEVGTTNRTRAADFGAAVTDRTAVFLRVHPSNFRVEGFTERPDRAALVALARERGVLLVEDLGSGLVGAPPVDAPELAHEALDAALAAGVDLVCCSGDKLLGGPQAGILAGRADVVARLRRHPLYRALRCDKLVLAALEATLAMYRAGQADAVPARHMLGRDPSSLLRAANRLAARVPGARVEPDETFSGGGALPAFSLPARVVTLSGGDPDAWARRLRQGTPPIVARVARDRLILDPRTLLPGDEDAVVEALTALLGDTSPAAD
jgi:L-seryl-tRNA(Ser) seleniumtransferase